MGSLYCRPLQMLHGLSRVSYAMPHSYVVSLCTVEGEDTYCAVLRNAGICCIMVISWIPQVLVTRVSFFIMAGVMSGLGRHVLHLGYVDSWYLMYPMQCHTATQCPSVR